MTSVRTWCAIRSARREAITEIASLGAASIDLVRSIDDIFNHRMNPNMEPFTEHASSASLRPLSGIRAPARQPMLEEEIEVPGDERIDLVNGVEIGPEKDREFIIGVRNHEARTVVVERVCPIGVGLHGYEDDRGTVQ